MVLNRMVFKGTTQALINVFVFSTPNESREREVSKIYHSSLILPIIDFVTDGKLNYDTTKV